MSILEDIKLLKDHYTSMLNWYSSAIERIELDIQKLWNDYFLSKNSNTIKLTEVENSFKILKSGSEHFRAAFHITEKRLDELDKQEYALINNKKDTMN